MVRQFSKRFIQPPAFFTGLDHGDGQRWKKSIGSTHRIGQRSPTADFLVDFFGLQPVKRTAPFRFFFKKPP